MTVQIARRMTVQSAVRLAIHDRQMAVRNGIHLSVQAIQLAVHEMEVKSYGKGESNLPVVTCSTGSN